MTLHRTLIAAVISSLLVVAPLAAQTKVEVTNNQSFPIAMPLKLLGDDAPTVMVKVDGNGKQTIDASASKPAVQGAGKVSVEPVEHGIRLKSGDRDLGTLAWDLLFDTIEKDVPDSQVDKTQREFDRLFQALPMKFAAAGKKEPFETWAAEAGEHGLRLRVELDVHPSGFVDIRATFTNESAPKTNVTASVITRWQQPKVSSRTVNYNNVTANLTKDGATPFRQGGGSSRQRHMMVQRGVDWLNFSYDGGPSVAMLHDFAPSFTIHRNATAKTPAHWAGANSAHLGQEAVVRGETLYSVTEIARPNIRMYRSRVEPNVLPPSDYPLPFTSRLVVSDEKLSDERVDEMFVAYCGFIRQEKSGDTTKVMFGVPYTKFGTAYFPFSTLGENFERYHMPGQSKETYWPLSADTVTKYKLFADDIKRDLRIAKTMGFESIRLHHLEEIERLPRNVQHEYLDFFMSELKHLGLTALLDVKLHPQRVADLVKRYGPQVDGVEYDNEVLIFAINDEDVPVWKDVYKAVKEVDPNMPVWLTAHTNFGAFERIRKLGVPFDKVGQHAYMDSLEAIPSARSYSLAAANYASEIGKEPVITEWNWRFLTRMTPEARAEVYPPIFENVLKTKCMPLIYQFQFQESLAMASKSLRGIRHYEQLNLSRRPRPEAIEMMDLIERYGNPQLAHQLIRTSRNNFVELDENTNEGRVNINLNSQSADQTFNVKASVEAPESVEAKLSGKPEFRISPGQQRDTLINFKLPPDAKPGFYHLFLRLEFDDKIGYGWAIVQKRGPLKIEKDKATYPHPEVTYTNDALDYDFNRDLAVVYTDTRDDDSRWDVESAWLLYQTLESATGRPVAIYQLNDLPDDVRKTGNLIVVGTPKDLPTTQPAKGEPVGGHPLIESVMDEVKPAGKSWVSRAKANDQHGDWLIVAGEGETLPDAEKNLNAAAIDLVLRYWVHAKDSGARRVPLVDTPIEKGADPKLLP
jgi:hypothetical protein